MKMISMCVRVENGIKMDNIFGKHLLPQIGSRVDQDRCAAIFAAFFNECGTPKPSVFRLVRITFAPVVANARNAAGRSAPENGQFNRHQTAASAKCAGFGTLPNRRKKFSVVCRAISV